MNKLLPTCWTKAAIDGDVSCVSEPPETSCLAASTVELTRVPGISTAVALRTPGESNAAAMTLATGSSPRHVNRRCNRSRARATRLRTVPSGQPSRAAACSCVRPSQ